jgi:TolA-binding protein
MMKGFVLIVLGLLIGLVVAMSFNQDFGSEQQRLAPVSGGSIEDVDALRAHVDQQIAALDNRLAQLGGAVDDLRERLASVGVQPAETETIDRSDPRLWRGNPTDLIRARQSAIQQDDSDRILAAGFTQDRIDLLDRRVEELQMEARQAQAEGGRTGESIEFDPLMPIPVQ